MKEKMRIIELPFRATTIQACDWLAQQTGAPWTLARMIEKGLIPYVWLDFDPDYPALFGEANGGYAAPIFFQGDTQRLAAGSEDVLITITKDVYRIVTHLPLPGFRRDLQALRFLKKDLERLVGKLKRETDPKSVARAFPTESQEGITRDQVLVAFSSLVKIDLEEALGSGIGMFGNDGAKVKSSSTKAKHKTLWNPITLALGLNDVYRAPLSQLKRAFNSHDFLNPWSADWLHTMALLGK